MQAHRQLALNISLRDSMTFESYFAETGSKVLNLLKELLQAQNWQFAYLWGGHDVGKTHLLMACCNYCAEQKFASLYLPLAEHKNLQPEILDDIEHLELICIDDLQAIIGLPAWEEAIFHCFNKMHDSAKHLIIAANAAPQGLQFGLLDLQSRMSSNMILHLQPLSDEQKINALIWRAKLRGLDLPVTVAKFLLHRYARDMQSLLATLDVLDKASLQEKRRLTLPFVKQIL